MALFTLAVLAVPAALLLGALVVDNMRSGARDELDKISRQFDDAQFKKDGARLQNILSADMLFIRGSGKAGGKSEFIAAFTDARIDFDAFKITNRKIVPIGENVGVVSADAVIYGRTGDLPFREHIRYSDTFARMGGTWQVVHVQVTPIK